MPLTKNAELQFLSMELKIIKFILRVFLIIPFHLAIPVYLMDRGIERMRPENAEDMEDAEDEKDEEADGSDNEHGDYITGEEAILYPITLGEEIV